MHQFYITVLIGFIFIIMELMTVSFYLLIVGLSIILSGGIYLICNSWFPSILISSLCATFAIIFLNIYRNKNKKNPSLIVNHIGNEVTVVSIINKNHCEVSYSGTIWHGVVKNIKHELNIGDILLINSFSNDKLELEQK